MKALLRPYQVEAVENIRAAIRSGKRRILLTLPTGAGKTLTAASMIAGALSRGKRSQFVAHRKELIDQTVTAFARLGITSVGVVRAGDKRRDSSQPIQVSSIQTLANRVQPDFDLVFVDEAHRSNAKSYLDHVFARHKRAIIIGLSATPCRGDGKPLDMFDELVVGAKYSELIDAGFLAAPLGYSTPMLPDLSTVRTTAGEYNQADLEDAVNRGALIGDLYTQWAKHPPARTVAFAVSVAHSRAIVERFTAEGVRAEHLDGTTPEDERAAILARLASGETTLVSNVGVLCLDERTEILTRQGWVGPDDMTPEHDVAAWTDGAITFERPTEIHRRARLPGERMVRFAGSRLSVRVTEGHNIVHAIGRAKTWTTSPARDVVGRVLQLPVAGDCEPELFDRSVATVAPRRRARLISKTRWNIANLESWGRTASAYAVLAEATRRVDRKLSLRPAVPSELSADECRFIGFWLGDGSRAKLQSGGVEYIVGQSHRYAAIVQWFEELVGRLGYDVCTRDAPARKTAWLQRRWSFARGTGGGSQERKGLSRIEPFLKKGGTDLFWGLSRDQLLALLEGLWLADGDHCEGGELPRQFLIHGTRKSLFDILQAVCVCRGMAASLRVNFGNERRGYRRIYGLRIRPTKTRFSMGRDRFAVDEAGPTAEGVWCVTVPSGKIVTRRDGLVVVMGNCEGWDLPSCKRLIVARPTKSLGLWLQMAGRILRPHDGQRPIILDHGGNWDRHGAPHQDQEWSLTAKPKKIGVAPSRVCEQCFGHILASARVCPLCGAAQPEPAAPERDPAEDVIVDLALRSLSAVGDIQGEETRLEKFRGFYLVARERGWMPGAVVHRYRELLGEEPPASWVSALKADYRNDGAWKASVAQRKRERDEKAAEQTHCACGCGMEMTETGRSPKAVRRREGRPWTYPPCAARAAGAALTPEQRSDYGRRGDAALKAEAGRKGAVARWSKSA